MRVFKPYYSKPLPEAFKIVSRNGVKFAQFVDRRGQAREQRLTRNGKKMRCQVKCYRIEFEDSLGVRRKIKAFTNKVASEQLGNKIDRLLIFQANDLPLNDEMRGLIEKVPAVIRDKLIDFGLVDLQDIEQKEDPAGKPLNELLAEFADSLKGNTCSPKYIGEMISNLRRVFADCDFAVWSDISRSKIIGFLNDLRDGGLSYGRSNNFLKSLKAFCSWMIDSNYVDNSPIRKIKALDAKLDRRHVRRVLELDELRRLLETTAKQPERYGLTGPERAFLYRFAVETGLRAKELRTLTIGSFNLDMLIVTVKAGNSKHRREDIVNIRKQTAAELKQYFAGKLPAVTAFKGSRAALTDATAKMIREDLEAAKIPYEDEGGRVFDFHALRHQCGTLLVVNGVSPKVCQSVMRHSDINLTMSLYAHTLRGQEAEAVERLPDLSPPTVKKQRDAKTGTEL